MSPSVFKAKTIRMNKVTLIMGLAMMLIACNKKDPSPSTQCQITGYLKDGSVTGGSDPYTYSETQTTTFNSQHLIAGYNRLTVNQYTSGTKVTTSGLHAYEYDANGFITTEVNEFTYDVNGAVPTDENQFTTKQNDNATETYHYEYANGLITKVTHHYTAANTNTAFTAISIYEYNGAGKITKMSLNTSFASGAHQSSSILYEYTDGILSKLIEDDGLSEPISSQVEVNSQGLIIKKVNALNENHYQYDADGNITKLEQWTSGKKMSTYIWEYDTNQSIYQTLYPTKKGMSQTNLYGSYSTTALPTHNIIKATTYNGEDVITSQLLSMYEFHRGHVATRSYTSTYLLSQDHGHFAYIYDDCQ